jgi:putative flippase GtrA
MAGAALLREAFARLQVLRYGAASGAAFAADMGLYAALVLAGLAPWLAAMPAFACGVLVHHAIGRRHVFAAPQDGRSDRRIFVEYAAAGLTGLVWTTAVVAALTAPAIGMAWLPAKLVAVASNLVLVFVLLKCLVFRRAGAPATPLWSRR